jgi:hypothetical protein
MIFSQQRYISKYLTHFIGRSISDEDDQFELFIKIIKRGWLLAKNFIKTKDEELEQRIRQVGITFPMKILNKDLNDVFIADVVCFADIPVSELFIHSKKYSRFAISFYKDFLVRKGANPVFYISSKTFPWGEGKKNLEEVFKEMMQIFINKENKCFVKNNIITGTDLESFKLNQYLLKYIFTHLKFWDYSLDDFDDSNYYFEREWRLFGGFQFSIDDINRVIFPKKYSMKFKKKIIDYNNEIIFIDSFM